jgi:ribosomal protein S18 acetylase RimI-like enzyme
MHARSLEVEKLDPTDLVGMAQCMALDAEAFPYPSIPMGFPAGLRTWVARTEERGRVLGFLVGTSRPPSFYIQGLAVAVAVRRSGVGRALVRACAAGAEGQRLGSVVLHVGVLNRSAVLLYDSEGFEIRRKLADFYRTDVYGGVRDAYEMVLLLRRPSV